MAAAPACPRCGRALSSFAVMLRRNRWGGTGPAPRPEPWWRCPACGWLGCERRPGEPPAPMRRLEGEDGDCVFCGEEESTVASEPRVQQDGSLGDWLVCLACGTSNGRRLRPPAG
ncbi:hypothetical protein OG756_12575 [Streptomyces sp. NBC_01310]|uniref:hypothetical protein n=1 Tax=Streptomyces sp. NBC_01310 TaxID=2903820 RepID=UPI0035B675AF|nr:hypothetical protein OG756_12575 [Streptomyces sp. NBC_01310]